MDDTAVQLRMPEIDTPANIFDSCRISSFCSVMKKQTNCEILGRIKVKREIRSWWINQRQNNAFLKVP